MLVPVLRKSVLLEGSRCSRFLHPYMRRNGSFLTKPICHGAYKLSGLIRCTRQCRISTDDRIAISRTPCVRVRFGLLVFGSKNSGERDGSTGCYSLFLNRVEYYRKLGPRGREGYLLIIRSCFADRRYQENICFICRFFGQTGSGKSYLTIFDERYFIGRERQLVHGRRSTLSRPDD